MNEIYDVVCMIEDVEVNANIKLYGDEYCRVVLQAGDIVLSEEANNYFGALMNLRKQTEPLGIKILCNGCCKNVFPSPMILEMGDAVKAYKMTMGKPAKTEDLVDIFEPCDLESYATIEEQAEFYNMWINRRIDK